MSEEKFTRAEWQKKERDEQFLSRIRRATVGYRIDTQRLCNRVLYIINEIIIPDRDIKVSIEETHL